MPYHVRRNLLVEIAVNIIRILLSQQKWYKLFSLVHLHMYCPACIPYLIYYGVSLSLSLQSQTIFFVF